jgi:transposase-like protein
MTHNIENSKINSHLGYDRYERNASENARNGSFKKHLTTENGQLELEVPRDRKGNFEPTIVKKKQTRLESK